jgi:uncharacterized membrane protein
MLANFCAMTELEGLVRVFTLTLGSLVEGAAAVIVAGGILKVCFLYLKDIVKGKNAALNLRLELGKTLAITLEFLLAADILRTAVAPTWADIGKLASIAVLRTLLNYFLDRELETQLGTTEIREQTKSKI